MPEVVTKHRYINKYPFKKTDEIMILGTIHPHLKKGESFEIDFFYGNSCSLWNILGEAFKKDFSNLRSILATLGKYNICVTDMIKECKRKRSSDSADRSLYDLKLNTKMIKNALIKSDIHTIYFTSGFGKNNACRLFLDEFKIKYTATWNNMNREFIIEDNQFKRPIKAVVLYSPSNAANIGIAKSQDFLNRKKNDKDYSIKKYKKQLYREKFDFMRT